MLKEGGAAAKLEFAMPVLAGQENPFTLLVNDQKQP